jgi:hypothetical protein
VRQILLIRSKKLDGDPTNCCVQLKLEITASRVFDPNMEVDLALLARHATSVTVARLCRQPIVEDIFSVQLDH